MNIFSEASCYSGNPTNLPPVFSISSDPLYYFLLFSFLCCYVKNVLLRRVNSLFADVLSSVIICLFLIYFKFE